MRDNTRFAALSGQAPRLGSVQDTLRANQPVLDMLDVEAEKQRRAKEFSEGQRQFDTRTSLEKGAAGRDMLRLQEYQKMNAQNIGHMKQADAFEMAKEREGSAQRYISELQRGVPIDRLEALRTEHYRMFGEDLNKLYPQVSPTAPPMLGRQPTSLSSADPEAVTSLKYQTAGLGDPLEFDQFKEEYQRPLPKKGEKTKGPGRKNQSIFTGGK